MDQTKLYHECATIEKEVPTSDNIYYIRVIYDSKEEEEAKVINLCTKFTEYKDALEATAFVYKELSNVLDILRIEVTNKNKKCIYGENYA